RGSTSTARGCIQSNPTLHSLRSKQQRTGSPHPCNENHILPLPSHRPRHIHPPDPSPLPPSSHHFSPSYQIPPPHHITVRPWASRLAGLSHLRPLDLVQPGMYIYRALPPPAPRRTIRFPPRSRPRTGIPVR